MFDFHEKRKIRSILYSKLVIFTIFLLAILLSLSVYNRYEVANEMRTKLDSKRSELNELEIRAQTLESKVQYLENERGVEEELRNRFDVAKEGEQVIILLDSKNEKQDQEKNKAMPDVHSDSMNEEKGFFSTLFNF